MLEQVAAIISSVQYGSIFELQHNSLIIQNQFLFIWNVLPKFTGSSVSKAKFLKEMNNFGFHSVRKVQSNGAVQQNPSKTLEFRGPQNCLRKLKELEEIRKEKKEQAALLNEKVQQIKKSLEQDEGSQKGQAWSFAVLDAISSLKSINRTIYALNSRGRAIVLDCRSSDYEGERLRVLHSQNTMSLLNDAVCLNKKKETKTVKFYSENDLKAI